MGPLHQVFRTQLRFQNAGRPAGCRAGLRAERPSLYCRGSCACGNTQGPLWGPRQERRFSPGKTRPWPRPPHPPPPLSGSRKISANNPQNPRWLWTRSRAGDRLLLWSHRQRSLVGRQVKEMEVLATLRWWGGRTGARLRPLNTTAMWKEEYDVHFDFLLQLL